MGWQWPVVFHGGGEGWERGGRVRTGYRQVARPCTAQPCPMCRQDSLGSCMPGWWASDTAGQAAAHPRLGRPLGTRYTLSPCPLPPAPLRCPCAAVQRGRPGWCVPSDLPCVPSLSSCAAAWAAWLSRTCWWTAKQQKDERLRKLAGGGGVGGGRRGREREDKGKREYNVALACVFQAAGEQTAGKQAREWARGGGGWGCTLGDGRAGGESARRRGARPFPPSRHASQRAACVLPAVIAARCLTPPSCRLASSAAGAVFYSVPHAGSRLADWGWYLRYIGGSPAKHVRHLKTGASPGREWLSRLGHPN